MKALQITVLFLAMACSQQNPVSESEPEKNEPLAPPLVFKSIPFDSLTLKEIVLRNDKLLDLPVGLPGKEKSARIDKIIQSDSSRLSHYKACKFMVTDSKKCNGYQHLFISKEIDRDQVNLEPYQGLYLVIIDPENRIVTTEKLQERAMILLITSITCKTDWHITPDSTLTVYSTSSFCSDVVVEGEDLNCWTNKITRRYTLRCDGLGLLKEDVERVEN